MNRFSLVLIALLVLPVSGFAASDTACAPKTAAEILEGQWAMTTVSTKGLEGFKAIWTFVMNSHSIRQLVAETPDGVNFVVLLKNEVGDNHFTMRTQAENRAGYADMKFATLRPDKIVGTYVYTATEGNESHPVDQGNVLLIKLHPNQFTEK